MQTKEPDLVNAPIYFDVHDLNSIIKTTISLKKTHTQKDKNKRTNVKGPQISKATAAHPSINYQS